MVSKERKKLSIEIYQKKKGEEMKKHFEDTINPLIGLMEWVDWMNKYKI